MCVCGGGLESLPGHFDLFHKGDGMVYFFTVCSVFPPCLVVIYLNFTHFFHKNNYFHNTPGPPPVF